MLDKLVIGPARYIGEECSPHEAHPGHIRGWVQEILRDRTMHVVCTFSPTVIALVLRELEDTAEARARVVLRPVDGPDVRLVEAHDPNWLAHFDVADLYIRGELAGLGYDP